MPKLALLANLQAKPGKAEDVARFLASALPLAQAEAGTTSWFALQLGPETFGIFDTFDAESGRRPTSMAHRRGADGQGLGAAGAAADDREGRHPRRQAAALMPSTR